MLRHFTFIFAIFVTTSALAEPVKMKADAIFELLNGKKIEGQWNGMDYTQSFWTNGVTIYISGRGNATRREEGKWRVNEYNDTYESAWGSPRWSAYDVMQEGDTYYWSDKVGQLREFRVIGE